MATESNFVALNSLIYPMHYTTTFAPKRIPAYHVNTGFLGAFVNAVAQKLGIGEFATGGLQLAVIGAVLASARYFGGYVFHYLKRQFFISAEFDSRDESYSWILNWLSNHPYSATARNFSVSTSISRGSQRITGEGIDSHSVLPPVYFLPAPGDIHIFTYNRRLLWLSRDRARPSSAPINTTSSSVAHEIINISTLGRSRTPLQSLIQDAQQQFLERDLSRTVIYAADQYGAWRRTRSRPKRPLDTVILEPGLKSFLVGDAKEFLASERWYSDRGLPYRRGYLFYGTPGSGKTSFIYALAGELGLNIYVVNLSNKSLTDDTLTELVTETATRSLLLIEDIDVAFIHREKGEGTTNNITLSGFLNAIDGVAAQEGRILCLTTNHIESLDPALIRPGRIDIRVLFTNASRTQACELFSRFYPTMDVAQLADAFSTAIPEKQLSMAQLQGYLMGYKRDPHTAVKDVTRWVEKTARIGEGKGFQGVEEEREIETLVFED